MILTLNADSSSIKFALFKSAARLASGLVDRIGAAADLRFHPEGGAAQDLPLGAVNHRGALRRSTR